MQAFHAILSAVQFLTILPVPASRTTPDWGRVVAWFPLVGAAIGLALGALDLGLRQIFPPLLSAGLTVVALAGLSGGLHLDGLIDSCDGLFCQADPQRRLEIMRDSRVGSFGVLGAVAVLLLKTLALAELPVEARSSALVAMATLGRWAIVRVVWAYPYGRPEGLGAKFKAGLTGQGFLVATLSALAVAVVVAGPPGLALLAAAWGATAILARWMLASLPGLTGDTYGFLAETMEVAVLCMLVALAGAVR